MAWGRHPISHATPRQLAACAFAVDAHNSASLGRTSSGSFGLNEALAQIQVVQPDDQTLTSESATYKKASSCIWRVGLLASEGATYKKANSCIWRVGLHSCGSATYKNADSCRWQVDELKAADMESQLMAWSHSLLGISCSRTLKRLLDLEAQLLWAKRGASI